MKIAELEGAIAEAAKSAEAAEALRAEMGELRRQGEERRVEFELTMAGARSVRAPRPSRRAWWGCLQVEGSRAVAVRGSCSQAGRQGRFPQRGGRIRRGQDDEAVAQDCRPSRERGVADGQQHRVRQYLTNVLDKVYMRAPCSTCLNGPRRIVRAGRNARENMAPKIEVTGLGDYTYNVGYKTGSITYEFETKTFSRSTTTAASSCLQLRNRSVPLSRMDSSICLSFGAHYERWTTVNR